MRSETDPESLRRLLKEFNEIDPKFKTAARRELRSTGDSILSEQRAILDGPLPAGIAVTGKTLTLTKNAKSGKSYLRLVNTYGDRDVQRGGRSTGLREGIKSGLVTRVVTGKTRQSIEIKTQNSKGRMSTGWNSRRFRHPIFGNTQRWAYQAGQPYFFDPIFRGRAAMISAAIDILNSAIEGE